MEETLPVEKIREDLIAGLRDCPNFVLKAPTGSGKSTRVPPFLLEVFPAEGDILVLQPRRLPARALARRVASERGERVGDSIGYRVRLEKEESSSTRIWFMTEGLFLRRILDDPTLPGVAAVIFDEFHERHLDADMALGMVRRTQQRFKPELVIGVMSATLAPQPIADFLGNARIWEAEGRRYPVAVKYQRVRQKEPIWEQAIRALEALEQNDEVDGDVLIFMPSVYAIHRTLRELESKRYSRRFELHALHGELDPRSQDSAIEKDFRRKIIVSTNVAETSLTIPGVRVVIDSGLARIPILDPSRGINTILDQRISLASAEQRAGRAGRETPGIAIRLWDERDHAGLIPFTPPEVQRLDLSGALLSLRSLVDDPSSPLPWYELPEARRIQEAERLLKDLDAIDQTGRVTEIGRVLSRFPMAPRNGRILLAAKAYNCEAEAKHLIAIEQGRSLLLPLKDRKAEDRRVETIERGMSSQSDWILAFQAWLWAKNQGFSRDALIPMGIHRGAALEVDQLIRSWNFPIPDVPHPAPPDMSAEARIRAAIFFGFRDQLAKRKDRGTLRVALVHERNGELSRYSQAHEAEWLVGTTIEERSVRGQVTTIIKEATPVDTDWLVLTFPQEFREENGAIWDDKTRTVRSVERRLFRDLVLEEKDSPTPPGAEASSILAEQVMAGNLVLKQWNTVVENWIQRVNCLSRHYPEYEIDEIDEEARRLIIGEVCDGAVRYKEIKDREVLPVARKWLSKEMQPFLDQVVPERFKLPSGRHTKLRFEENGSVTLSAKIQDLYDLAGKDAVICEGRCRLKFEILAPNFRPVQLTDDLDGFWEGQYPAIKKDLFGRYPKHEWR